MKKKWMVLLIILLILTGCSCQTPAEEDLNLSPVTAQEHLTLYRPVLEHYVQALSEGWNESQYVAAGLSNRVFTCLGFSAPEKLGYGLVDLDGDGIMELLIGSYHDARLMDGYRLENGAPKRLFLSVDNLGEVKYEDMDFLWDEWFLCREDTETLYLFHEVQKDWLICGYFRSEPEQNRIRVTEGYLYNSIVDEYNPWYRMDGYNLDYTQGEQVIPREDADVAVYGYECAQVSLESLENSWLFSVFS